MVGKDCVVFFRLDMSELGDVYFLSGCEIVELTFSGNASLQLSVWDEISGLCYSMLIDVMDYRSEVPLCA